MGKGASGKRKREDPAQSPNKKKKWHAQAMVSTAEKEEEEWMRPVTRYWLSPFVVPNWRSFIRLQKVHISLKRWRAQELQAPSYYV